MKIYREVREGRKAPKVILGGLCVLSGNSFIYLTRSPQIGGAGGERP